MFSGKKYVSCVHAIKYNKGSTGILSIQAYSKNLNIDILMSKFQYICKLPPPAHYKYCICTFVNPRTFLPKTKCCSKKP